MDPNTVRAHSLTKKHHRKVTKIILHWYIVHVPGNSEEYKYKNMLVARPEQRQVQIASSVIEETTMMDIESFACDDSFSHTANTLMRTEATPELDGMQTKSRYGSGKNKNKNKNRNNHEDQNGEESDDDIDITKNTNILWMKWSVVFVLVLSGTAIAAMTFTYTTEQEDIRFRDSFRSDASRFQDVFVQRMEHLLWALTSLASLCKSQQQSQSDNLGNYYNITIPNFETQTLGTLETSHAASLFFAPSITNANDQAAWEQYALEHAIQAGIADNVFARPISAGIYRLDDVTFKPIRDDDFDFYHNNNTNVTMRKLPIWQITRSISKRHLNMLNLVSMLPSTSNHASFSFLSINATQATQFGSILSNPFANYMQNDDSTSSDNNNAVSSTPRSISLLPILNTIANNGNSSGDPVMGVVGAEIEWITLFDRVLPNGPTICIILENSCGQIHTYHVKDGIASYLGSGDQHERPFNYLAQSASVAKALEHLDQVSASHESNMATTSEEKTDAPGEDEEGDGMHCVYQVTIYPTEEYEDTFHTGIAYVYMLTVIALAVTSIVLFIIYTILVDRRQKLVLDRAARSNAIIKSLFPAVIRRRLFGSTPSTHPNTDSLTSSLINPLRRRRQRIPNQRGDTHNPKTRLTNFLTSTSTNEAYSMEHQSDEPIAEMFSNTTVVRIFPLGLYRVRNCVSPVFLIRYFFFRTSQCRCLPT